MARGEQLKRQWRLLEQLQAAKGLGRTIKELAEHFGISSRTIQRDLEFLRDVGLPLEHQDDDDGKRYWRLRGEIIVRETLSLTVTEAISLTLARELFTPLAGTPFFADLERLVEKILDLVPQEALAHFRGLKDVLLARTTGHVDYDQFRQQLRAISHCLLNDQVIEITYRAAWRGEKYATRVDPYHLLYFDGDLYLVGRSHRSDGLRMFKLPRIESAESTGETFKRPADTKIEKQLASGFGVMLGLGPETEVTVRFSGPEARLVEEREWHPSQRLERDGDDAIVAYYKLRDLVELKRWVRSFGPAAIVLSPRSLADEMAADLKRGLANYDAV